MIRKIFITLLDIGFRRNFLRIIYELNKKLSNLVPSKLLDFFIKLYGKPIYLSNNLSELRSENYNQKILNKPSNNYTFNFLNETKTLKYPISWNNPKWKRLWQFNLHYFDWLRDSLEQYLITDYKDVFLQDIKRLIQNWIDSNPIGRGDGWHSYTISLRIRNWIWILKVIPNLENDQIKKSIWEQFVWLSNHKEYCYEGNHLIENISSLIICSLNFSSEYSRKVYLQSTKELEIALSKQILFDGGHEERSAYYHFLLLDRLTEVACIIKSIKNERPEFLLAKLKQMLIWAESTLLKVDKLPIFNDSPKDLINSPDEIIRFTKSFIFQKNFGCKGLRGLFIKKSIINNNNNLNNYKSKNKLEVITDLPKTGWTIIRPNEEIELCFKNGEVCPKHLPPHVHSDILAFSISLNGDSILSNCGTSEYQNTKIRHFERSSSAHNIFQLGSIDPKFEKKIKWIDPVEVWNSFRAGRKAVVINRKNYIDKDKNVVCKADHDGFKRFGAYYERKIEIKLDKEKPIFLISDCVNLKYKMAWRSFFHLGPNISADILKKGILRIKKKGYLSTNWFETWEAAGFGKRIKRKSLCLAGFLDKGYNEITFYIDLEDLNLLSNEK
tara:strand:+ start:3503 stop:5335 length:1833 start_codon:yes stop_codon:yes gene_type:complete